MAVEMGERGTRLNEPCPFCSGPRVQMRASDDLWTIAAVVCLRCDGPAPVRLPGVDTTAEQPKQEG